MKTVVFAAATGTHVRDMLRSGVLQTVQRAGLRVVIYASAADDPVFSAEFKRRGVHVERLLPYELSSVERKVKMLRDGHFIRDKDVRTMSIMVAPRTSRERPLHTAVGVAARLVEAGRVRRLLESIDERVPRAREYEQLLSAWEPALVITASPGFNAADRPILRAARRLAIPTACLVSSWDNLTSKGVMAVHPDHLVVWNEAMRAEAMRYHDIDATRVWVAGIPQFDAYADPTVLAPRGAFAGSIGFDPGGHLITYATSSQSVFDQSAELAGRLARTVRSGRWGIRTALLIRLHPRDTPHLYEPFEHMPQVVVERPGRQSSHMDWDPDGNDVRHLANTMYHSSVVVNVASTTSVDAAVFDTPVVNIAFDLPRSRPYLLSTRRYYDYLHYRPIVDSNGVDVVSSFEDLCRSIDRYLVDPALHREGRRRIVERVAGELDGKAGERTGSLLVSLALGEGSAPAEQGPRRRIPRAGSSLQQVAPTDDVRF